MVKKSYSRYSGYAKQMKKFDIYHLVKGFVI